MITTIVSGTALSISFFALIRTGKLECAVIISQSWTNVPVSSRIEVQTFDQFDHNSSAVHLEIRVTTLSLTQSWNPPRSIQQFCPKGSDVRHPALLGLACELRTKSMPPIPYGFIAHVYASFMKKVFNISQWEWEPRIQHNCELDDLRAGFEITEG